MTEVKKRLGRGLDALLSPTRMQEINTVADQANFVVEAKDHTLSTAIEPPLGSHARIHEISLDAIQANPHQPRLAWDESKLLELSDSIKANGVIQPILVRQSGQFFQIIAGERRMRAARLAGKTTIPAIVRSATEEQMLELALVENIHRADLGPLERAKAYQRYLRSFSMTQEEAAKKLGEDRATIANYIRLLDLSDLARDYLASGKISMGHARALLAVSPIATQQKFAQHTAERGWSVRELEQQIRQYQTTKDQPEKHVVEKPANITELEKELMQSLGTRVRIKTKGKKGHTGTIMIDFFSLDDFDRIRQTVIKN